MYAKLGKHLEKLSAEAASFAAAWSDVAERYHESYAAALSAVAVPATRQMALFSVQRAGDHLFTYNSEYAVRLLAEGDVVGGAHRLLTACTAAQVRDLISVAMKFEFGVSMLLIPEAFALYHRILAKCVCHDPFRSAADRLYEEMRTSAYVLPSSEKRAQIATARLSACADGRMTWEPTQEFLESYAKQVYGPQTPGMITADHQSYAIIPAELVYASFVRGDSFVQGMSSRAPASLRRWISSIAQVAEASTAASPSKDACALVELSRKLVPESFIWGATN